MKDSQRTKFDDLRACAEQAIEQIYVREAYLIAHGLSEWTISAQFHYYMRKACRKYCKWLKGLDFDSEYNLMSKIPDEGVAQKVVSVRGEILRVRPDFIIHKRGDISSNLLWVELKRKGRIGWKDDLARICSVTRPCADGDAIGCVTRYDYGLGVFALQAKSHMQVVCARRREMQASHGERRIRRLGMVRCLCVLSGTKAGSPQVNRRRQSSLANPADFCRRQDTARRRTKARKSCGRRIIGHCGIIPIAGMALPLADREWRNVKFCKCNR